RNAGLRVVMVTGDQPETARKVATEIGLLQESDDHPVVLGSDLEPAEDASEERREELRRTEIFARVEPRQKLDLVEIHQSAGAIVGMTGDGVNDAPALKKADIGIAMGRRGTQVAKEAAEMILTDDAFGSILTAVEQGRVIFDNIRRFVVYLLSGNVSEILLVAVATLLGAPLPLLPLQILFLNMVLDVFPALALAMGEGDPGVMQRAPRAKQEPILRRNDWSTIVAYSVVIAVPVLAAQQIALDRFGLEGNDAVTISFLTLAFARLWHVFNMRRPDSGWLRNEVTANPWIWGALALCALLLVGAVWAPGLSTLLRTSVPDSRGWLIILGLSLVPTILIQAWLSLKSGYIRDLA
ncbi:MAG: HAD-IC family P-type ATPase, partial [Candidatus Eisenbacteria bacterium]|nr:HAD-IC family P-type ATPase [Candidatus Eisenbacteria bacterium]